MKANLRYFLLVLLWVTQANPGQAQIDSAARHRDSAALHRDSLDTRRHLAIFVPLYLDSAFDAGNNYRYDRNFPKFLNPGLEFYEGAQLALDSLQKEQAQLEVEVYDTRSASQSLAQIIQSPGFQKTQLIIGHVSQGELQQLASAAAHMNIPFINVNFPNDGGIVNNPSFVILNSTLRTHCEGIYKFLQRNYALKPILMFQKKGAQEERLKNYFTEIGKNTASVPLKIKFVSLEDNFDAGILAGSLDSNIQTICIAGSLDENFGRNLCQGLASLSKSYHTILVGMPTWDNITDLNRPEYAGEEVIYTTPFYINPNDNLSKNIQLAYKTKFYSRPSDMVFRGYETVYHFSKLLLQYGKNLSGSIGEKKYKVFSDFDIEPVLNKQTMVLDYFENKKLNFIRKTDGNITAVN
ncbi:MAG TPA: ABC transporter substrate-binding protein [Puia sp.]|nr:ABC transporter substrate-binding protein [Puia sp.]